MAEVKRSEMIPDTAAPEPNIIPYHGRPGSRSAKPRKALRTPPSTHKLNKALMIIFAGIQRPKVAQTYPCLFQFAAIAIRQKSTIIAIVDDLITAVIAKR